MGYAFTDRTILIRVQQAPSGGGVAQTAACDNGDIVPVITLFTQREGEPGENTTKHEVAHAVQYAYMGAYLDGVASWPWWMEGSATWMAVHAHGNANYWASDVADYLEKPWLPLHQTAAAYIDTSRTQHMYGTALLASFIEETHGIDTVRATWEAGGAHSGEQIWFPDILTELDIAWEPFWQEFMARVTVVDSPHAVYLSDGPYVEETADRVPASGEPLEDTRPHGYGLSLVKIRKQAAIDGYDELRVEFESDADVPWLAVVVTTKGRKAGGKIVDWKPLEVGSNGKGSATIDGFDGSADAWLVVSPQSQLDEGFAYTWSARIEVGDTGTGDGKKGCGCDGTGGIAGWLVILAAGVLRRRR